MAHQTVRAGYEQLVDRLNRFPQGAPPSDVLYAILKMLFSEREAGLVALLPIRPFTVKRASRIWKMSTSATTAILEELAGRGILLDMEADKGKRVFVLPPPMAGFFEFSLMLVRGDLDQKVLSELFFQYLNVEHDFVRELFAVGETQLGRAASHRPRERPGAQELLPFHDEGPVVEHEWNVAADVWSVTSYKKLYWGATDTERWNLRHPGQPARVSHLEPQLAAEKGVFVAASDYLKALPAMIAKWVPGPLFVLGTDGYGRSENREALRDFFEVDAHHIAYTAL